MFNRLNRKLAIEAYPIDVDSYIKEVKGEPTEAEIKKLFDEGKYDDPNPNVDEPGFHKPPKLAFKYLKVSFAPFLEEAKKQITEAQTKEPYEKDMAKGLQKVPELPADPTKKDGGEAASEKPADKPEEKPAEKPEEKSAGNPVEKSDKGGCEATDDP